MDFQEIPGSVWFGHDVLDGGASRDVVYYMSCLYVVFGMYTAGTACGDRDRAGVFPQCLVEFLPGFRFCFLGNAAGVYDDQIINIGKFLEKAIAFVLVKLTSYID